MIFLGKEVRNYGEPFIVAELSCNHLGDFNRALHLIEAAKWSGVDAVKIQCYEPCDLTINNGYTIEGGTPWEGETLYELYEKAGTPLAWIEALFKHAEDCQIPIFSSVYSNKGLALLQNLKSQAYKIASYEANDIMLIKRVLGAGKPVVISTGTLGDDEFKRLLNSLTPEEKDRVILLHCVSKYPTDLNELGLSTLVTMQETTGLTIGFSCHSDDPGAVLLSCAYGAAMVEVHLTLDDEESTKSPDWEFSYTPEMLLHTVQRSKLIRKAIGYKDPIIEDPARKFKRSLFVIKDIKAGEIFTQDNVGSFRPNLGCSPHLLPNILGRRANRNLAINTPMEMEYVE